MRAVATFDPASSSMLLGKRGWTKLICDLVLYTYDQVVKLRVTDFEPYPRENAKGKVEMVSPANRIRTTQAALAAAAWFASTRCVLFCEVAGFHPSQLWTQDRWREAVGKLLRLTAQIPHEAKERHLIEECLARYAGPRHREEAP